MPRVTQVYRGGKIEKLKNIDDLTYFNEIMAESGRVKTLERRIITLNTKLLGMIHMTGNKCLFLEL